MRSRASPSPTWCGRWSAGARRATEPRSGAVQHSQRERTRTFRRADPDDPAIARRHRRSARAAAPMHACSAHVGCRRDNGRALGWPEDLRGRYAVSRFETFTLFNGKAYSGTCCPKVTAKGNPYPMFPCSRLRGVIGNRVGHEKVRRHRMALGVLAAAGSAQAADRPFKAAPRAVPPPAAYDSARCSSDDRRAGPKTRPTRPVRTNGRVSFAQIPLRSGRRGSLLGARRRREIVADHHPALHHELHALHLVDVDGRIARNRDDVGELALLD
jgi:hypothetical protein